MSEKVVFDLSRKETEAGWAAFLDRVGLSATPVWFDWLSWVLIMSVFQYLADAASSPLQRLALNGIIGISTIFLLLYFTGFFFRLEFHGLPFVRSERVRSVVSVLLSAGLAYGACLFSLALVRLVKHKSG